MMRDLPSLVIEARRYSVERQGWPVRCPSCDHEWVEHGYPMHGNVEVVTQPMRVATSCEACGVRVTIIGSFGEVVL